MSGHQTLGHRPGIAKEALAAPTFERGLHQAQVKLRALVVVAHALGEPVALQAALFKLHNILVALLEAGQGPEFGQRQIHVLRGIAVDLLDCHPSPAAPGH